MADLLLNKEGHLVQSTLHNEKESPQKVLHAVNFPCYTLRTNNQKLTQNSTSRTIPT